MRPQTNFGEHETHVIYVHASDLHKNLEGTPFLIAVQYIQPLHVLLAETDRRGSPRIQVHRATALRHWILESAWSFSFSAAAPSLPVKIVLDYEAAGATGTLKFFLYISVLNLFSFSLGIDQWISHWMLCQKNIVNDRYDLFTDSTSI